MQKEIFLYFKGIRLGRSFKKKPFDRYNKLLSLLIRVDL